MVMIIIHIAYTNCLVTNDVWHAYEVIRVYKVHRYITELSGSHSWRNTQYCGWLVRSWARSGPVTFNGASNTVAG